MYRNLLTGAAAITLGSTFYTFFVIFGHTTQQRSKKRVHLFVYFSSHSFSSPFVRVLCADAVQLATVICLSWFSVFFSYSSSKVTCASCSLIDFPLMSIANKKKRQSTVKIVRSRMWCSAFAGRYISIGLYVLNICMHFECFLEEALSPCSLSLCHAWW